MIKAGSIIRAFLLTVLITFLTGASIFAEEASLTTVVTKETSGIYRIRQYYFADPNHGTLYSGYVPAAVPNTATRLSTGSTITVDLAATGGHALTAKTLISVTGGIPGAISVGDTTTTGAYGGGISTSTSYTVTGTVGISGPGIVKSWVISGNYIESFTVTNRCDAVGIFGSINVTVIEYN